MLKTRVMPCLLLQDGGLVKSVKFRRPVYVGDPVNAVRIFNKKEVDELVILDIAATREDRGPDFEAVSDIVSEAFIPVAYGGGISTVEQAERLFHIGIEKVVVNAALAGRPTLVDEIATRFGSQSLVASIDAQRKLLGGFDVRTHNGQRSLRRDPADFARELEGRGAGEIFLTSIDRDGTGAGYDCELIGRVAGAIKVPLVACGGAGRIDHLAEAVAAGASAVAAGSLFVFHGPHRAVLITYPDRGALEAILP